MKLEIKHLAPYLPYGLMALVTDQRFNNGFAFLDKITGIYEDLVVFNDSPDWYFDSDENDTEIKLALRPLSDLDQDGEINTPDYLQGCCYSYVQHLISQHYDVFGLIDKGLAININTL